MGNWLIPVVSLRSPSFFGPVTLAVALMLASSITPPTYQGFSVVSLSDPTFRGELGIWGACQRFKKDNATSANPNATLTGNATFDALVHDMGSHAGCSSSHVGWTYSLTRNSTGITSFAWPNTTLGVNTLEGGDDGMGGTYVQVMSSSQSSILIIHMISGIVPAFGILLIMLPYRRWEESSPHLARLLKVGSLTIILTVIGFIMALVSFVVDMVIMKAVTDNINNLSAGGGVRASIGNLCWFALPCAVLYIPPLWSTRGPMGKP